MTDPDAILTAARRAGAQQAEVFHVQTEETTRGPRPIG